MDTKKFTEHRATSLGSATNLETPEQKEFVEDLEAEEKQGERQVRNEEKEDKKSSNNSSTPKKKNSKEGSINLRLSQEEKNSWMEFSTEIDFSLSTTIRKAMRYYIQQYRKGKLDI